MRLVAALTILVVCFPGFAEAGRNAAGAVRLSWEPALVVELDTTTLAPDLAVEPGSRVSLYLVLTNTADVRSLAVGLRWRPADAWNGYAVMSASPSDDHGWHYSDPPGSSLPNDSSATWHIGFPTDTTKRSSVEYVFQRGLAAYNRPADFYVVSAMATDSNGDADSLAVIGGATILGGSGRALPGVVSPEVGSIVRVVARDSMAGATITLARGLAELTPVSMSHIGNTEVAAVFNLVPENVGPYDVLVQRSNGTRDTLWNSVRVATSTSLGLDTLGALGGASAVEVRRRGPQAHRAEAGADSSGGGSPFFGGLLEVTSCPSREGWVAPPTFGAIQPTICTDDATPIECTLNVFPSRPGHANVRYLRFEFVDCSQNPMPNIPAVLELIPQASVGGHCHSVGPPPPGGSAVGRGGTNCALQPDGSIVCVGNTGSDGRRFELDFTWPENGGYDHVLFYSTDPSAPFYNSRDGLFKFCSSAATSLFPVAEIPDTFQQVGANSTHPLSHSARKSTRKAIQLVGRAFRQAFPGAPITQINDMSLGWGGLFDICADEGVCSPPAYWTPPHREHRIGNNIDLRTHALGVPRYSHAQLTALQLLIRNYFTIVKHASPPHWHLRVREEAVPQPW